MAAGRLGEAIQLAERAAALASKTYGVYHECHAEALSNLGTSLGQQGRGAEAAEALRQSLSLAPHPLTYGTLLAMRVIWNPETPGSDPAGARISAG